MWNHVKLTLTPPPRYWHPFKLEPVGTCSPYCRAYSAISSLVSWLRFVYRPRLPYNICKYYFKKNYKVLIVITYKYYGTYLLRPFLVSKMKNILYPVCHFFLCRVVLCIHHLFILHCSCNSFKSLLSSHRLQCFSSSSYLLFIFFFALIISIYMISFFQY